MPRNEQLDQSGEFLIGVIGDYLTAVDTFHVLPKNVPEDAPSARIAFFKDPDGNILELFQPLGGRYPQGGD